MIGALSDLLRDGKVGPVALGATKGDVVAVIGEPKDALRRKGIEILKYGPWEFAFCPLEDGEPAALTSMRVEFTTSANAQCISNLPVLPWSHATNRAEVHKLLGEIQEPVVREEDFNDHSTRIVAASGAVIGLANDHLTYVQMALKESPKPSAQLNVLVPADVVGALREQSQLFGTSLSRAAGKHLEWFLTPRGQTPVAVSFDSQCERDPATFQNLWKIAKSLSELLGPISRLLTWDWRSCPEHLADPTYTLRISAPLGDDMDFPFSEAEVAAPERLAHKLQQVSKSVLERRRGR